LFHYSQNGLSLLEIEGAAIAPGGNSERTFPSGTRAGDLDRAQSPALVQGSQIPSLILWKDSAIAKPFAQPPDTPEVPVKTPMQIMQDYLQRYSFPKALIVFILAQLIGTGARLRIGESRP
jgi:hypothetical protein